MPPRLRLVVALAIPFACTPRNKPAPEATPTAALAPEGSAPAVAALPAPEPAPSITHHAPPPATLAIGSNHVCALVGAGEVSCWGAGREGQLGPGVRDHRSTPVQIPDIHDAALLVAARKLTCAVRADRSITCWGELKLKQSGAQTTRALGEVVEVVLSGSYPLRVCGRRGDGTVACVRVDALDGPATAVAGIDDAVGLAADYWGLYVLRATGGAEVVDFADHAREPATALTATPLEFGVVTDLGRVDTRVCLQLERGELQCRRNRTGWESEVPSAGPLWKAKIPGDLWASATDYDGNYALHCVRDGEGKVLCWGSNTYGELGIGGAAYTTAPRLALSGPTASISAGDDTSCAVDPAGALRCLANGILEPSTEVEGVRALAISLGHACAIVGGGEARCWGFSDTGALGSTGSSDGAVRVPKLADLVHIGVGDDHSCGVRRDHSVRCWGLDDSGQLGDGRFLDEDAEDEESEGDDDDGADKRPMSATPLRVKGLHGVVTDLAVAADYSCVGTTADLQCWGLIPDLDDDARILEPQVFLTAAIRAVDAEDDSLCALTEAGDLHCWGSVAQRYHDGDFVAAEHDGEGEDEEEAEEAEEAEDAPAEPFRRGGPLWAMRELPLAPTAIAVGSEHACLLGASGEIRCWGLNEQGALGDGTTVDRPTPALVQGLPGAAEEIVAGAHHTCARVGDGGVYCWGAKTSTAELLRRTTATPVVGLAPFLRGPSGGSGSVGAAAGAGDAAAAKPGEAAPPTAKATP